jgi:hypothetical protein
VFFMLRSEGSHERQSGPADAGDNVGPAAGDFDAVLAGSRRET